MNQAGDFEGDALIVAGPTCSGKSALALALAREFDGIVINADSMQVYRELRVLTARPTAAEEAACPHRLYGVRPADEPGSVAWWRREALACLHEAWSLGKLPILCGGTGLYLRALTDGLTAVPDPGEAARAEARALLEEIGPAALHARLWASDPDTACLLRPSDGQRLARAWEVLAGTGRGLSAWRNSPGLPPAPARFTALRLNPARADLRAAIAARFTSMLANGALEEVAALLELGLPEELPAMRAHGVPELAGVLRRGDRLEEASRRVILSQGQYTKRQATWFAHHDLAPDARTHIIDQRIPDMTQFSERQWQEILSFVRSSVDAPHQPRP